MKRLLKIIVANLLILAFGICVIELAFGTFLHVNPLAKLNLARDVTIHYDLNGIYESSSGTSEYTRDEFGLRGFYRSPERIDILTVGGSAVDQRFVTEGETFQDHMRKLWSEKGRDLTVVNAGVDGQSTLGHIKNFQWWFPFIPNLHARFILFYIGVNDLFGNVGTVWDALESPEAKLQTLPTEEREQLPELTARFTESGIARVWARYKENSALWYLYRTLQGMLEARQVKLDHGRGFQRRDYHWTDAQHLQDHAQVISEELKLYRDRINALIAATENFDARPIIVTQSAHYFLKDKSGLRGFNDSGFYFKGQEVLGVDIYHFLKLYSDTAIRTCRETSGCIAVNLFDELDFEVGDFYDNVHNTPQGARKIASYLVEKLEPYLAE